MTLAERLAERIQREGPMPFDQWMDACLYDPQDGYYMRPGRKTGAGEDADFATSPTLHPFFGAAVGMEAAAAWERLGSPDPYIIVEFGGGEGDLSRAALAWLDRERPHIARKVEWVHVERSPTHKAKQAGADRRFGWSEGIPRLDTAFLVANEFLDALSFKWLERTEMGWNEVHIGWDGQAFMEVLKPSQLSPSAMVPAGVRIAFHQASRAWLQETAHSIKRAEALIIDYGERYLWGEDRPEGSVRTYRRHEYAGTPWDHPGDQDITASIEFAETAAWGREAGWRESWFGTQEAWLIEHGILDAINATRRDTVAGASAYLRLRQLMLPTMFGAFKVQRLLKS